MTDSPTRRKRYGAGICWEYMDKGVCLCDTPATPEWHPLLSISSTTSSSSSSSSAPSSPSVTIVTMPKRIPEWVESLKYIGFIEGDPSNFAILSTTYEEREEVKALGACYAPGIKKWIVIQGEDLAPFEKWRPRINNRSANEVVLYNNMDLTSAVRELQRCGVKPVHFTVVGGDSEAQILRNCLSTLQKGSRSAGHNDNEEKHEDADGADGATKKRSHDLIHENNNLTPAADGCNFDYGEYGTSTPSAINASRPRYSSSPESLQKFVKQKQDVSGGAQRLPPSWSKPKANGDQSFELSTLLSTAKSALVRCNSVGGSSSAEQKQFNEAIYNVMEVLTAKVNRQVSHNQTRNVTNTSTVFTGHVDPRQVTPMQKG